MFIFNVEWPYYIKLWWQKKIIFLQMHNTDLQWGRVKCLNLKLINLEKME